MNSSLFRKQAITTYVDTDVRGSVLQVLPPRLVAIYSVVLAAVLLGSVYVLGSEVSVSAEGSGVLRPAEGVRVLRAPANGTVTEVGSRPGAQVKTGDLLFRMGRAPAGAAPAGSASPAESEAIVAPIGATVDELWVQPGGYIRAGDTAAVLVPAGPLVGYMALAESYRGDLRPSTKVRVTYERGGGRSGEVSGRVLRVSSELLSGRWEEELKRAGTEVKGPSVLVEVAFDAPTADFASGMRFSGQVLLQRRRVVSLLMGS